MKGNGRGKKDGGGARVSGLWLISVQLWGRCKVGKNELEDKAASGEPHRMRTDNLELSFLAGVPPWTPRQPAPTIQSMTPAKAGPVTQTFCYVPPYLTSLKTCCFLSVLINKRKKCSIMLKTVVNCKTHSLPRYLEKQDKRIYEHSLLQNGSNGKNEVGNDLNYLSRRMV
jgi:hypothetical protein